MILQAAHYSWQKSLTSDDERRIREFLNIASRPQPQAPAPSNFPSILPLLQVLQALFSRQAQDIAQRLTLQQIAEGPPIDVSHWTPAMVAALRPYMLQFWQQGLVRGLLQLRRLPVAAWPTAPGMRPPPPQRPAQNVAQPAPQPRIRAQFDLFNPRVLDAVDNATMTFCRATNDTITGDLNQAILDIRAELKEGLPAGESHRNLARRINQIVASPERAFVIANTESRRALAGGSVLQYKESGVIEKKEWLASADACPLCLDLNGTQVGLDEPFLVLARGGPYAVIMHAPAHPSCFCDVIPVL